MTITAHMAELAAVRATIEAHPMCAELRDEPPYFLVIYPAGDFPTYGVRTDRSAAGLHRVLPVLERHWLGSYPAA